MLISNLSMKRFVLRLFVFLFLMFILDYGFGMAMKYMQDHAKGGYVRHHNYILHQANEEILIFGSSRAIHHYNPKIITDSLGMSCYNCGQDGNGIVLFYGWWQLIEDRYHPKMIIYDVNPNFDLLVSEDNHKYLGWLRSEYENKRVKQIFEDIDPTEKYKMHSMMFRYNSKFLQIITDCIHPLFRISSNGYLPYQGKMDKMRIKYKKNEDIRIDSLKLRYIHEFVKDTKKCGVKLVFVASPIWYGTDEKEINCIKNISKMYNIPFYDFSNNNSYVHKDVLFKDGNHLNSKGADLFTSELSHLLKEP